MREITAHGITLSVKEWADRVGICDSTIRRRIRAGKSPEECVRARGGHGGARFGVKRPRREPQRYQPDNEFRHARWV